MTTLQAITLATAVAGAVTGTLGTTAAFVAIARNRPRLRLERRPFDENRLRVERPDLRQPLDVATIPLDLSRPCYCLTVSNVGQRAITILEAHAAYDGGEDGLKLEWNTHWFRSLQTLQLKDRNVACGLTETDPVAKFIFPTAAGAKLLALTVTTASGRRRYYSSFLAHITYLWRRRAWRRKFARATGTDT